MKTILFRVLCWVAIVGGASGAEGSDYKSETRSESEVFTSKVLKVYACEEGGAEFVAYVVNWRGHEVVVSTSNGPAPAKRYEVGDTIRCQMFQSPRGMGDQRGLRMTFMAFPPWASLPGMPLSEDARLEAIGAEVAERRRLRESLQGPVEKPSPTKKSSAADVK